MEESHTTVGPSIQLGAESRNIRWGLDGRLVEEQNEDPNRFWTNKPPLQLGRENVNLTSPHLEHLYKVRSNSTSSLNRLERNTGHDLMRWIEC